MKEDFARIDFPHSIKENELYEVFEYLGRNLPALIEYYAEIRGRIGFERFFDEFSSLEEKIVKSGAIRFKNEVNMLGFNVLSKVNDSSLTYNGIEFETIPGYGKEELRLTLGSNPDKMDSLRKALEHYFKK